MDAFDQWPVNLVTGFLPPSLLSAAHAHLAPLSRPLSDAMAALGALVRPVADRFVAALMASPDVVFLGVVLALLWLTLHLLSWVRRVIIFWTRVAINLALLACLGGLLAIAWRRGPEQTMRDGVVVVTKLVGFAAGVGSQVGEMVRNYEDNDGAGRTSGMGGNAAAGWR